MRAPAPTAAAPAVPPAAPHVAPAAPLAPAAPAAPDPRAVAQLTDMGFKAEQAAQALASTDGDVEAAAAILLGGDGDMAPAETAATDGPAEVSEAAVEQLVAMGFPADQARQALTAGGGNVENAMAILLGV